tara:strand:+ start:571 stop:2115 length:1545 start_codon:yes stop_codon:yes gene_type:complete
MSVPLATEDKTNQRFKELSDVKLNLSNPASLTEEQLSTLPDDFVKGGETQSPLGDLGILGLTGAAVKNPLKALEVIGTDPDDYRELSLEMLLQKRKSAKIGLNPIDKIKKLKKGVERTFDAVDTALSPRQLSTITEGIDDSNPNVFFSKKRAENQSVLGPRTREAGMDYQEKKNLTLHPDTKRPTAQTDAHHISVISDSALPVKERIDGDRLLKSARAEGIPIGDEEGNYIAILDVLTKGTRSSKVHQLAEKFPNVNRRTLDDMLGTSEFSTHPELTGKNIKKREGWVDLVKDADPDAITDLPQSLNPKEGKYPSIKFYDENNKVVREWQPKTLKEWGTRFDEINKHYGSNITKDVVNKIKVDPRLNTYGADHKHLHEMLKQVESWKAINTLRKEGKWSTLPFEHADKMYKQMLRDQHKVAINMANWRYGKIAEYFKELNPKKRFSKLSPEEQAIFFKKNISEISSKGRGKDLPTVKQLLKNLNFGFKDMLKSNKRRDELEAIFGLQSPVGDFR